jgi:MYXO-CTERM domain-containing protein
VAGADAKLFNDATVVVLMRDGTRTVLSMQNDYQGPPEDFALVVPVPVVLHEGDVKTLPKPLFERVDRLAAPRLVEYWETDPCEVARRRRHDGDKKEDRRQSAEEAAPDRGVTVEAEFVVGEYQIQILSAQDATGLDTWLREQKYNIPEGAEPLLRPYVQSGMKFFVAKVDAKKVKFENGRAMLSPLRFHYDSPDFALPVRLGLINAQGPQDLLIHILATERYKVANYPNVTIPTNLVVREHTKDAFGKFYVSLFDKTLADNPGAVVTEYAWQANSCDPCPQDPLNLAELVTLGADVLPSYSQLFGKNQAISEDYQWSIPGEFVLTRLHARYDAQSLGEDLVFEAASRLEGGRGRPDEQGKLDPTINESSHSNQFQARYAILHRWTESVTCLNPERGHWGYGGRRGHDETRSASNLAFEARDAKLEDFVGADAHRTLGLPGRPQEQKFCNCTSDPGPAGPALAGLGLLGLLYLRRRRTKATPS